MELLSSGFGESTVLGTINGLPCQSRIDWVRWTGEPSEAVIVDLKTCGDLDEFEANSIQYGYHRQLLNFSNCGYTFSYVCNWVTVPPASNGDGVACRQDVNGDGNVDGEDLGLLLIEWGDAVCQVQPTYPCLNLDGLQLPR